MAKKRRSTAGLPWNSPEALAELTKRLSDLAIKWEIAADHRGDDDPTAPVATALKALAAALEMERHNHLQQIAKPSLKCLAELREEAEELVRGKSWEEQQRVRPWRFDPPRAPRHEDADQLRSMMEGWLREKNWPGGRGSKRPAQPGQHSGIEPLQLATHFVAFLTGGGLTTLKAQIRDEGVDLDHGLGLRKDYIESVAAEFAKMLAVDEAIRRNPDKKDHTSDPESYIKRGLKTLGCRNGEWLKGLYKKDRPQRLIN